MSRQLIRLRRLLTTSTPVLCKHLNLDAVAPGKPTKLTMLTKLTTPTRPPAQRRAASTSTQAQCWTTPTRSSTTTRRTEHMTTSSLTQSDTPKVRTNAARLTACSVLLCAAVVCMLQQRLTATLRVVSTCRSAHTSCALASPCVDTQLQRSHMCVVFVSSAHRLC